MWHPSRLIKKVSENIPYFIVHVLFTCIWYDIFHVFVSYTWYIFQVFDLHRLRGVTTPTTFQPDAHYDEIGNCHNIVASEETGYVYPVACDKGDYPNICQGKHH